MNKGVKARLDAAKEKMRPSRPLWRCEFCRVRMYGRDMHGHLHREHGLVFAPDDLDIYRHFEEAGRA